MWACASVYLIAIIGPRAKGEITLLAVEGEVRHVHHAWAFSDGWSIPGDLTSVSQHHVRVHRAGQIFVGSTHASIHLYI